MKLQVHSYRASATHGTLDEIRNSDCWQSELTWKSTWQSSTLQAKPKKLSALLFTQHLT